ncbi:hypothetical protein E1K12_23330 [Salmonella enterica subsp. enterica serovar Virchow]|uniref:Inner membrane protein n=1 Tax=Salmonella enterica subsp. enterica serovar Concord TaxID=483687 RepID=A0A2R4DFC1_SALET|nr:hypothetical protein [Salmonella enterica]EBS6804833.1 hypothetical protein [Salmonella enterica subsp. enterica serovar Virchow]ECH1348817.1 hypothetical protein [Salmonella enterica subsp. enterica serovar Stanley]EDW6180228.1 hypothetical protein [Salmonella enterica subsp. enterica]EEO3504178.1 hypothetical protein [Salmonella enterica subsp. enterica serovar Kintambo]AVS54138.1 hypothetical protein C6651_20955 [Salmonella enterica subsp. enterica serovar Concord]
MLDTEFRVACLQGKKMPAIISLIYLMFSLLVFTKKITISNVLSAFLLFLSLYILHHKSLLIFIYCLIIVATVILHQVKTSADKKAVFYFSMPCWLLILSVIINLMNK